MFLLQSNQRHESTFKKIYYGFALVYSIASVALFLYYLPSGDSYHYLLSLATIVLFPGLELFYRLTGLKRSYPLDFFFALFVFMAWMLGTACQFYVWFPYFDKIMHTLSGCLTMLLALPLFYALKNGHKVEKSDCKLAIVFCILTALAVAGVWEMCEYGIHFVTGVDVQKVQTTGINDTMQDMLVCTAGALLMLPMFLRYYRTGHGGALLGACDAFIQKNFPQT